MNELAAAVPIALAIVGLAVTVALALYGINMSVRDVCLQLKQLRESLPTLEE